MKFKNSRAEIGQLYVDRNEITHTQIINKDYKRIKNQNSSLINFSRLLKVKTKSIFKNEMISHRFLWLLIPYCPNFIDMELYF